MLAPTQTKAGTRYGVHTTREDRAISWLARLISRCKRVSLIHDGWTPSSSGCVNKVRCPSDAEDDQTRTSPWSKIMRLRRIIKEFHDSV